MERKTGVSLSTLFSANESLPYWSLTLPSACRPFAAPDWLLWA